MITPHLCGLAKGYSMAAALIAILLSPVTPGFSQVPWPDKPQNIKALPATTTTEELRTVMFSFSDALGVNCIHCHVAEDWHDFSTYDFASDSNQRKETARLMIRMVNDINGRHLTKVKRDKDVEGVQVNCATCHSGRERPESLDDIFSSLYAKEGVRAVVDKYEELRAKYYGKGTYDFSENTLNRFGYELLGQNKLQDAIDIFQLNVKMNPQASNPYDSLAEAHMKAGNTWLAIINYSRSVELDPSNRNGLDMLKRLTSELKEGGESAQ